MARYFYNTSKFVTLKTLNMKNIPMSSVTDYSKNYYSRLNSNEKIAFKENLYWRNQYEIELNKYPLMKCVMAFINQNHYVMSGQCAINSRRYEREKH